MAGLRLSIDQQQKLDAAIAAKTRLMRPTFLVTRQVADAVKAGLAKLRNDSIKKDGAKD